MQYRKILGRALIPITLAGLLSLSLISYELDRERDVTPSYTPTATYTATATSTPSPSPTPDPIYDLQRTLEQKVRSYEQDLGMNISVAVTDLQTRKTISVDGREPHRPGCVANQFPLYMIAEEAQKGNLDPAEMDWYIRNSVNRSNPASTGVFLAHYFGSEAEGVRRVQDWMNKHGIEGIYNHVPTHGSANWTNNMLTAEETNEALSKLYLGELFDPYWIGYVLGVLDYDYFLYGIPSGTGPEGNVYHKIGYHWDTDGWVHADTGIVTYVGFDESEYAMLNAFAISIFTENGAAQSSFAPVAQDLTRTAYDYFRARY